VIEAHRKSIWAGGYDLVLDDQSLASFNTSTWRTGGSFVVDGRPYEVRSNLWASTYSLVAEDGSVVATASRVGRKDWTVEAGSATHTFRRVSPWRHEEELHVALLVDASRSMAFEGKLELARRIAAAPATLSSGTRTAIDFVDSHPVHNRE